VVQIIDGCKLLILKYQKGHPEMIQKREYGYCGYLTRRQMVFYEVQALNYGDFKSLG
jgi:hypothetical protein